jgi:hypothetical protein
VIPDTAGKTYTYQQIKVSYAENGIYLHEEKKYFREKRKNVENGDSPSEQNDWCIKREAWWRPHYIFWEFLERGTFQACDG